MAPPPPITLDARAVSGITGSISISCWIIVFTPQLYENFRRQSAEGLSLTFVILWLAGDILNVAGSILQDVLPTMIALSIWYTLADIVLLLQILIYNKRNAKQLLQVKVDPAHLSPATPLLESYEDDQEIPPFGHHHHHNHTEDQRLLQSSSNTSTTHGTMDLERRSRPSSSSDTSSLSSCSSFTPAVSQFRSIVFNLLIVVGVFATGVIGWYFSEKRRLHHVPSDPSIPTDPNDPHGGADLKFDFWGQIFGWGCAILYLGSRLPQILLNFKRKSVEGISFLFFLFACLGNLTYVISILALDISPRYLLINGSWLAGSVGTLFLDMIIFIQFWVYNRGSKNNAIDDE